MLNSKSIKYVAAGLLASASMLAFSNVQTVAKNDLTQEVKYTARQNTPTNLADLVEAVSPAVVQVISKGNIRSEIAQMPDEFFGQDRAFEEFFKQFRGGDRFQGQRRERAQPAQPSAIGSGFIVESDGIVITNNHVIKDAEEVSVRLNDGREISAKVLGTDPRTDLAVLKIDTDEEFNVVNWGDSEKTRVGDSVFAVGSPFGLYGSVTSGIVSARGREIGSGPYDDFIQIDAPINKGNSGGPLFDGDGNVIGVNTAIYSPSGGNVGIGFAIPSDMAQKIVNDLKEKGSVERGWVGISIQAVTKEMAESLDRDDASGALIAEIVPDGPADKAGLMAGDIILKFNDKKIEHLKDLTKTVATTETGSKADVEVWRDGKVKNFKVAIGTFEEPNLAVAASLRKGMDADNIDKLGLTLNAKLEIIDIDNDSPAAGTDVQIGEVVETVNNVKVSSLTEVRSVISEALKDNKKAVLLRVDNGQSQRFVAVPFNRA